MATQLVEGGPRLLLRLKLSLSRLPRVNSLQLATLNGGCPSLGLNGFGFLLGNKIG